MGCFDYTDPITRLNIRSGDEIIIMTTRKRSDPMNTYGMAQWLHLELDGEKWRSRHRSTMEEIYRSAEEKTESLDRLYQESLEPAERQFEISFDTYNDYGWGDETAYPDGDFEFCMVLRSSVEDILERPIMDGDDLRVVMLEVAKFCQLARVNLWADMSTLGTQHVERIGLTATRKLLRITRKRLDALTGQIREQEARDREWNRRYRIWEKRPAEHQHMESVDGYVEWLQAQQEE